jgi:hypothetical protein
VNLQWRVLVNAIETKSAFLLFRAKNVAHALPKRCFADAQEINKFRELLKDKFPRASLQ